MVGHLLVHHPAVDTLKRLIKDGELGETYYLYSQRVNLDIVRKDENDDMESAVVTERTQLPADERSTDPKDNRVLAAAVDGHADYVVTRNAAHFPEACRAVGLPGQFLQ